tara:strand:- start:112798 stop:114111 length:1314 start_codon:yes stop_codon:yes gene_type:complete
MPTDDALMKYLGEALVKYVYGDRKEITGTVSGVKVDLDGNLRIPMAFCLKLWPDLKLPSYLELPRRPIHCNTQLGIGGRDYQIPAFQTIAQLLIDTRSAFLSLQCGGGKTEVACKLIADFGICAGVLTDVKNIFPQWVTVLQRRTNARVCAIKSAKDIDPVKGLPDADVYVFMVTAAGKIDPKILKRIKFLIVDEATYFMTPEKCPAMLNFSPCYTLGLCAEIRRDDGMHSFIPHFFGDQMYRRISDKPFVINRVDTPYKPKVVNQRFRHGPDWNVVLSSLANNVQRNEDIIWLCRSLPNSKIIVGTKRKDQANYIYKRLKELGEKVETLIGNDNTVNNCRILVGIYSKMGRGVDIKNLSPDWEGDVFDTCIMALDLTKPEQFVGRVFRHSQPIVYHFVDDYSTLRKHYEKKCLPWYKSRNGTVAQFAISNNGQMAT